MSQSDIPDPNEFFRELVCKHKVRLFRAAMRILRNHEDAEDAVQEALLKAYIHIETFRGDSRLSTWLTSIVLNQALMQLRSQKRKHNISISDGQTPWIDVLDCQAPSAESLMIHMEHRQILLRRVKKLPTRLRSITADRLIDEKSLAELAKRHKISQAAAKSRLFRARLALQKPAGEV